MKHWEEIEIGNIEGFNSQELKYIDPFSEKVREISKKFDIYTGLKDKERIIGLIEEAKQLLNHAETADKASICYSLGTAYGDLIEFDLSNEKEDIQNNQIFYLRESINYIESEEMQKAEYKPYVNGFKLNLYTNYGNALDRIGRKIAAIEQYRKVLSINANFGMALGNLGVAYQHYGMLLHDSEYRDTLHKFSYHYLTLAVNSTDPSIYEEARDYFFRLISNYDSDYIENVLKEPVNISVQNYDNKEEYEYRKWALDSGLFLNPLNDLPFEKFCFTDDVLQLPNMILKVSDKPIFYGMFNQFKQEYIFARYQYYCSLKFQDEPLYADKETYLLNFGDYPQYSIRIEMLKSSFKLLYSLLDKVAYFINSYFDLGISERDVSFHNIWLKEKKGRCGYKYKNILNPNENFALASIYWVGKDFYKKLCASPNPQAKRIKDIRNALEHKYVKVCWDWGGNRMNGEVDDLAFYITESELYQETYNLLKLIREILICLSIAVSIEEDKKKCDDDFDYSKVYQINLMDYDDEWKV